MKTILLSGFVALAVIFGGAVSGLFLGKVIPQKYHNAATERIVQHTMGMISLLSALVLGLLVATAKNKFDANNGQVVQFSASLMLLNSSLLSYGPEVEAIRLLARRFVDTEIAETWKLHIEPTTDSAGPSTSELLESMRIQLLALTPETDYERSLVKDASEIVAEFQKAKWLRKALESDRIPQTFLWVVVAWISTLFVGFGLFAPRNPVAVSALLICAITISCAIAMIISMDTPFDGLVVVSPQPMLEALAQLSAPFSWHQN